MAARVTQVFVEVQRSVALSAGTPVSGSTTMNFSPSASNVVPARNVSATTAFAFAGSGHGGGTCRVYSATTLILSANPGAKNSSLYVSAATSLGLTYSGHPSQPLIVSGVAPLVRPQTSVMRAPFVARRIAT